MKEGSWIRQIVLLIIFTLLKQCRKILFRRKHNPLSELAVNQSRRCRRLNIIWMKVSEFQPTIFRRIWFKVQFFGLPPLYFKNTLRCVMWMYFNWYYKLVGHHKDNVLRNFDLQSSQQLSKGKGYLSDMVRLELLLMITEFKLSCYLSAKILNLPYTNSKVIYRVFKQENRIRSHSRGSKKPPAINDKHLQNTCKTLR